MPSCNEKLNMASKASKKIWTKKYLGENVGRYERHLFCCGDENVLKPRNIYETLSLKMSSG